MWAGYNPAAVADGQAVIQFVEKIAWIDAIKVDYFLGVDGISLPLVRSHGNDPDRHAGVVSCRCA